MIPILEYPPRLNGREAEQINALREYLLRLVPQLNELCANGEQGSAVPQWQKGDTGPQGPIGPRGDALFASLYIDDSGHLHLLGAENTGGVTFTLNEETGNLGVNYG